MKAKVAFCLAALACAPISEAQEPTSHELRSPGGLLIDFRAGVNTATYVYYDRYASDFARERRAVAGGDVLTIRLAPGGGWVGRVTPR